jgi:predicted metal-dependent hydrolase
MPPCRSGSCAGRLEIRRDAVDDDPVAALIGWYARRGRAWLPDRLRPWAERMQASISDLRVMPLGYRRGSCSLDGRLNIHWATMQLPPDLIDYVLAHEVVHLHERDHGERFWCRVERAMPDAPARRAPPQAPGPGSLASMICGVLGSR